MMKEPVYRVGTALYRGIMECLSLERILIIGGNGCGKTTFAKKLSEKLGLPLIHLDILYWGDHWQPVAQEEFDQELLRELAQPEWIIDGNIARTLPLRLQYCDTVIYMDFSRIRCLLGAIKRVVENYGKSRPDMGGYCPERFDAKKLGFLRSVWTSHAKNRERFYAMLNCANAIPIVVLRNRRQAEQFLRRL